MEEVRLLQVEGQIQALARCWLYLAAQLELQGVDPAPLERSMLGTSWPDAQVEPHAQRTMRELVEQLTAARENRERQSRYQATGRDD
ncbi:hypothetical protein CDR19_25770 [Ectopseudomonas toyotomiensis]|nr:hypothetical protein CDR19_25770 [Pseudomonas toyotomiensis]